MKILFLLTVFLIVFSGNYFTEILRINNVKNSETLLTF